MSAAPEAPAVAGPVTLRVLSAGGEPMASVDGVDGSWSWADVEARLPALLPGHCYRLMHGRELLQGKASLSEFLGEQAEGELSVSGVVTKTATAQGDLDLALIAAAQALDAERARALLAAGASAAFVHDPPGTWGSQNRRSALHMAIEARGRSEAADPGAWRGMIELLLAAKADVNATRSEPDFSDWPGCGSSWSAFEMVLPHALRDAALLGLFLDAGASPHTTSVHHVRSKRGPFGQSVSCVLHKSVRGKNIDVTRALLDAGATVDALESHHINNERGYNQHSDETSLHMACKGGDVAMVALLLERGADLNLVRKDLEQEDVAREREQVTDDPRDPDFEPSVRCVRVEETALHIAIRCNFASLVTLLVCAGADASRQRVRGDVRTSCEDLCGGDAALLQALRAEWSPGSLELFEEVVRPSVEAVVSRAQGEQ